MRVELDASESCALAAPQMPLFHNICLTLVTGVS